MRVLSCDGLCFDKLHILIPDGACTFNDGQARFHRAPAPADSELTHLLNTLIRRITRALVRVGALVEDPGQPWLDIEPGSALEQLASAAVRYRIAVGPMAGTKTMTLHSPDAVSGEHMSTKPLTAACDGFTPEAAEASVGGARAPLAASLH